MVKRPWFNVLGQPAGRSMLIEGLVSRETGSIIGVAITDAPLSTVSLNHPARRAELRLGRGGNSSGDIVLAFWNASFGATPQAAGPLIQRCEINAEGIDPIYPAAAEAVEEAAVSAMVAGTDTPTFRFPGRTIPGINCTAPRAALFREE
jgi:D-aminopeptidase